MASIDRRILLAASFAAVAFSVQLTYWVLAISTVDQHIIEHDGPYWRTSPPGSLFPLPRGSGMLQALSPVDTLDRTIYSMIHSNLYILVLLAVTLLVFVLGYMVGVTLSRQRLAQATSERRA
jgi:hypothetical protein